MPRPSAATRPSPQRLLDGFDPDRLARYEVLGWRAYYDRHWPKLLWLIHALCREEFRIPLPQSLAAAYFITRGAAAWAPVNHDLTRVRMWYDRFYLLAARYSPFGFDPFRASRLEVRYNDDHRRLSGKPNTTELVQTLTELHVELFGLRPDRARESAEWRTLATAAVDRITGGVSTDPDGDWSSAEEYLRRCYRSIARELQGG